MAAAGTGGWFNGVPIMGNVVNASSTTDPAARAGSQRTRSRRDTGHPAHHEVPGWSLPPDRDDTTGHYSERDELNELRKVAADLAKERDVLKRSASGR